MAITPVFEDREDLVAVALELGRADAVAGDQLGRRRRSGHGDAAEVLVVDDDVRRDAVGRRPSGAPGPQRGLGLGRRTPQLGRRLQRRPPAGVLDPFAEAHPQGAPVVEAHEHGTGVERLDRALVAAEHLHDGAVGGLDAVGGGAARTAGAGFDGVTRLRWRAGRRGAVPSSSSRNGDGRVRSASTATRWRPRVMPTWSTRRSSSTSSGQAVRHDARR